MTFRDKFEGAGTALLMCQQDQLRYAKFDGGQLLEMPYGSGEIVLDVALPDQPSGLAALERKLVAGELPAWLEALRDQEVLVYLPRFHAESTLDLEAAMVALGAGAAFDRLRADFTGITGTDDPDNKLYLNFAEQSAVVDVDESGTEAAVVTYYSGAPTAAMPPPEPIIFRADHPFLYFIRDRETGTVLFAGRLVQPAS